MHPALQSTLHAVDPEIADLIAAEERRQRDKIRLIASENYVSAAVLAATGSVLTNKYSEGYPGKRYYEGQQYIDQIEQLCIDRAKALFGADHANVQPYSGSPANLAVYLAFVKPGDTIMGMSLPAGGAPPPGWTSRGPGTVFAPCNTASAATTTASISTRSATSRARSARACCSPAAPRSRAPSTSPRSPRSRARSARCSS